MLQNVTISDILVMMIQYLLINQVVNDGMIVA